MEKNGQELKGYSFQNVWSKFAKNSILVGQVEAYCLVCECHLSTEESASEHLRDPAHATNLHAVGYCDKYQHDYIRKVKNGYFCGMCNTLLATATRVRLHVDETSHNNNRGAMLLSRAGGTSGSTSGGSTGSGVLAYGTVLLQEDAWHGLVDDTCVICNAEFDEKNTHKNEPMHILKLVQSKVLFGDEMSIYRKIDKSLYQCLTCNDVLSDCYFNDHFDSTDHITAYKQSEITNESRVPFNVTDFTDTVDTPMVHQHNREIDNKQSGVTKESRKISEVETVDLDDVSCEPIVQHVDRKHSETMFKLETENDKGQVQKENDNEIKNHLETEKDEKVSESKKTEHMKGNSQEIASSKLENRSQILDLAATFQKNEVNINLINDTAFCKKCTMNIDFDFNAINKHIDDHKNTSKEKEDKKMALDHGGQANGGNLNMHKKLVFKTQNEKSASATTIEDIRAVAKKNGMIYNGRELHCTTCDSILPVNLKNIEEHVSGNKHKAKMSQEVVKQEPKKNISKQPIEQFIYDTKIFDKDNCREFVINEKYCLPFLSLLFICKSFNELACVACNIKLSSMAMVDGHVNSSQHKKILEECCVITSMDSEFVREMRPGVYHCGFCNVATGDWKGLEKHLNTSAHKRCRASAERRLRSHMSDARANRTNPGVYHCSFCNYVANDWDTLNRHFSTLEHVRTKAREDQRVQALMGCIRDPKMRQQMASDMFETFKGSHPPNFSDSDSD